MPNKSLTIIAAIAVIGLLFLVYLAATFESPEGTQTLEIAPPVPRPLEPVQEEVVSAPAPVPAFVELPTSREPSPVVEAAPAPAVVEEIVELPVLNASDSFLTERVGGLETGVQLLTLLTSADVIRKFVVFVDNVADGNLPQMEYPVRRPPPRHGGA